VVACSVAAADSAVADSADSLAEAAVGSQAHPAALAGWSGDRYSEALDRCWGDDCSAEAATPVRSQACYTPDGCSQDVLDDSQAPAAGNSEADSPNCPRIQAGFPTPPGEADR
jgi:hypothetical protein